MRIKNKWYKELWFWLQERFSKKGYRNLVFRGRPFIDDELENQPSMPSIWGKNSGMEGELTLEMLDKAEREAIKDKVFVMSPCTPEAKRHMKKVHKEKGRIGGVK